MIEGQFGNYMLGQKLGMGGMATVYHATHRLSKAEVAIKVLHEHYATESVVAKRFEREAEIIGSLDHPHIVPIIEFGKVEKRPYLAMPYYKGGTLAEYFFGSHEMSQEEAIDILGALASGLDYAHSKDVVHRDFKLQNILLDENNVPSISDFGIARTGNTTRLTVTGQFLGTANYVAPEMLLPQLPVDYRADLYALGVLAYLLLTGRFPFSASEPLELAIKHRDEKPTLPSLVNNQLSTHVDQVLLRALAKDPNQRFRNADKFVSALSQTVLDSESMTTVVYMTTPYQDDTISDSLDVIFPDPVPVSVSDTVTEASAPEIKQAINPSFAIIIGSIIVSLIVGTAIVIAAFIIANGNSNNQVVLDCLPPRGLTEVALVDSSVEQSDSLIGIIESGNQARDDLAELAPCPPRNQDN